MTQTTKKLTSLDEMLGSISDSNIEKQIEKINVIAIDSLIPYKNQPFKPYEGNRYDDMIRSIKEMGVLEPLIVCPLLGDIKYEILAGNNRWRAAKAAGLTEVPIII